MKIQDMTPEQLAEAVKTAESIPPEVFRNLADLFRRSANQVEAAYAEKDGRRRLEIMLDVGEQMERIGGATTGAMSP